MKKTNIVFVLVLIVLLVSGYMYYKQTPKKSVSTFEECAALYPVMESYPEQCNTPDGKHFVRDIGNVISKENLIRLNTPQPNAVVQSPLMISGQAVGNWFFEASFPVILKDSNGVVLAHGVATAKADWMTTNFVPFEATLTFINATAGKGQLILKKDNPSGDPDKDDSLVIPVVIKNGTVALSACKPTGCSGEICSDEDGVASACIYKPQFACYKTARCERQPSGDCGWTETPKLLQCISDAQKVTPLPTQLPQ